MHFCYFALIYHEWISFSFYHFPKLHLAFYVFFMVWSFYHCINIASFADNPQCLTTTTNYYDYLMISYVILSIIMYKSSHQSPNSTCYWVSGGQFKISPPYSAPGQAERAKNHNKQPNQQNSTKTRRFFMISVL